MPSPLGGSSQHMNCGGSHQLKGQVHGQIVLLCQPGQHAPDAGHALHALHTAYIGY